MHTNWSLPCNDCLFFIFRYVSITNASYSLWWQLKWPCVAKKDISATCSPLLMFVRWHFLMQDIIILDLTCMCVFTYIHTYRGVSGESDWEKVVKWPWCNSYRCRNWTRQHEFKSRTRLIEFHIELIALGKVWIQPFSLQLLANSGADWVL